MERKNRKKKRNVQTHKTDINGQFDKKSNVDRFKYAKFDILPHLKGEEVGNGGGKTNETRLRKLFYNFF